MGRGRLDGEAPGIEAGLHFLPAQRHGDRRARPGAGRIRPDRGRGRVVAEIVDEDPPAPLRLGMTWSDSRRARRRPSRPRRPWRSSSPRAIRRVGSIGTTTCSPLPPVVLTKLARPSAVSRSRTSRAAATTASKPSPSSGSRSKTIRSALSGRSTRTPQGWISSTPICTIAIRPGRSRDVEIGLVEAGDRHLVELLAARPSRHDADRSISVSLPGRAAHHRDRPAGDMRQHPFGDRDIIFGEVPLVMPCSG